MCEARLDTNRPVVHRCPALETSLCQVNYPYIRLITDLGGNGNGGDYKDVKGKTT